jgi:hypothetical protein
MGDSVCAPLPPSVSFSVGVTGHRQAHGGYAGAEEAITATLNEIMIANCPLIS